MHLLFVLFESASGYALFRTMEFEEIGMFIPQVKKSVLDVSKFRSTVFLVAFHEFKSVLEALDYVKAANKGQLHSELCLFLEDNLPRSKDSKNPTILGLQEQELASAINKKLDIKCTTGGVVPELIRGIRFHFHKLIKGYKSLSYLAKAQQGLGHHYSRARMDFNINKFDSMIVQSVSMLDQLNKDINTMTTRIREWFSFHFPELSSLVADNESYIKCVEVIKNRKNMTEDSLRGLEDILKDSEKVKQLVHAAQTSMGMDIASVDEENIQRFLNSVLSSIKRKDEMIEYLNSKMNVIAPNISALMGELVGARLISQAGSLPRLARLPASTVQVLGAEKSLFKTMKKKGCSQKLKKAKGLLSRYLANKCALASRVDCFSVAPTRSHGEDLKSLVEIQRKFRETGRFGVDPEFEKRKQEALLNRKKVLRKIKKEKKQKKLLEKSSQSSGFNSSQSIIPLSNGKVPKEAISPLSTRKVAKKSDTLSVSDDCF